MINRFFNALVLPLAALLLFEGQLSAKAPELSYLREKSINGTAILASSNLAGIVINTATGKGISGVPVTDGYTYTITDTNGVYQMARNVKSRKAYYSLPSGYEVVLDDSLHTPQFYTPGILLPHLGYRADFYLTPKEESGSFTLLAIGDPQCSTMDEHGRYVRETIADIRETAERIPGELFAVTLGDVTYDSEEMWAPMLRSMSNVISGGRYIPFFQCAGNHDHHALVEETGDRYEDDWRALGRFVETFGPADYSFNRGDAHIVVMDDILISGTKKSARFNGRAWKYQAGITPAQFEWLRQDIAQVADPKDKLLIFCAHIPFRDGSKAGGNDVNYDKFYNQIMELFAQFGQVHIMIGHTHYAQNYIHTNRKDANGNPFYEHIHQSACGAWWTCNSSATGAPNGYNIYTVEGSKITDWVNKATGYEESYQMRVYSGNERYEGKYSFDWTTQNQPVDGQKFFVKGSPKLKNAFVVELWDDDSQNWTIELFVKGKKVGDFVRFADGECSNVPAVSFFFNELGNISSYCGAAKPVHQWYCRAKGLNPDKASNWEIVATHKIPGGKTRRFSVNQLTGKNRAKF